MKSSGFASVLRATTVAAMLVFVSGCVPEITSPSTATAEVGKPFSYQIQASGSPTSFSANVPPPAGLSVAPNSGLISGTPTEAGSFTILLMAKNGDGEGTRQLTLTVTPAQGPQPEPEPPDDEQPVPGHEVVKSKELFIDAPAILNDARANLGGVWHFRSALKRIAGVTTDAEVNAFADAWFSTWAGNTSLPGVDDNFRVRPWVRTALQQAFAADRIKLIAIVNRLDLTRFTDGDITLAPTELGEGRFIYEVQGAGGARLPFTIIFEYGLPVVAGSDLRAELDRWATRWHALGRSELGGANEFPEAYKQELQVLTDEYSANGTLNQIRTNEFLAGGPFQEWELREFHAQAVPSRLVQVPVRITPAMKQDNTPALGGFVNNQQAEILTQGVNSIPIPLQGAVSPVATPALKWRAPTAASPRAAFIVSFNTCSGCHAGDTGTLFQHLGVNAASGSPFLSGPIELAEPLPGRTTKMHDEMKERATLLAEFARDVPTVRSARFSMSTLRGIVKARANRSD